MWVRVGAIKYQFIEVNQWKKWIAGNGNVSMCLYFGCRLSKKLWDFFNIFQYIPCIIDKRIRQISEGNNKLLLQSQWTHQTHTVVCIGNQGSLWSCNENIEISERYGLITGQKIIEFCIDHLHDCTLGWPHLKSWAKFRKANCLWQCI